MSIRHLSALSLLLIALLPFRAMAQDAPTLSVSLTSDAPEPVGSGVFFWLTINYSCSGADCVNPLVRVEMPPGINLNDIEGDDEFPRTAADYYGRNYAAFSSPDGLLPAGSSGQVRAKVYFKYGEACPGQTAEFSAIFSADGASTAISDPVEAVGTGEFRFTAELIHEGGGAVGGEALYRIRITNPVGNWHGGLDWVDPEIVFDAPAGAEIVSASDEGVIDVSLEQAVWSLQTIRAFEGRGHPSYTDRLVTVRYPASGFVGQQEVETTARISGTGPAGCGDVYTLEDSFSLPLVAPNYEVVMDVQGRSDEFIDYVGTWGEPGLYFANARIRNTGNVPLENVVLDFPIAPERRVLSIQTGRFAIADGVIGHLSYQKNDQATWIALGSFPATVNTDIEVWPEADPRLSNTGFNPDTDQISALRWEYESLPIGFRPYNLSQWNQEKPGVINYVPPIARDGRVVEVGDVYLSCADVSYDVGQTRDGGTDCFQHRLVPDSPLQSVGYGSSDSPPFFPGGTQDWILRWSNHGPGVASNPEVRIQIPDQLEVVSVGEVQNYVASEDGEATWEFDDSEPGVLIWRAASIFGKSNFGTDIVFRIRPGAQGTYYVCGSLDSDAQTWRRGSFCDKGTTISVLASVTSTKQIQGSGNEDFAAPGEDAITAQGGPTNYRLTVRNTGNVALEDLTVVDILPHFGDKNVLGAGASRGSEWTPQLSGSIAASDDVEVAYSTSTNPCRTDLGESGPSGCEDPAWSMEPPSPITSVRSLRFSFSEALDPLAERVFDWPMVAPLGAPFDSRACNSFAYVARRADNGQALLPAEPEAVCAVIEPLEPAALGDFVWEDSNYNGLQDTDESGINGIEVTLMKPVEGGEAVIATNRSGVLMQTVTADKLIGTDEDGAPIVEPGYYLFSDLEPGDYFIRVTLPDDKAFARSDGGDEARDSDVDPATGGSEVIALGPVELYTVDVGLRPPNSPPTAVAGEYAPQECLAASGMLVELDGSTSSDPDGDTLTYTWSDAEGEVLAEGVNPSVTLPLGEHTITLTVEDDKGASATDEVTILVEDTTPPVITFASGGLTLWPPNHKYHTIDLASLATVTDQCDASVSLSGLAITEVTSDEPENARGRGDGNTTSDIVIGTTCQTVDLRAERQGGGDGRVYTVTAGLSDAAGNAGAGSFTVSVPHSKKSAAVDSGEAYSVDAQCTVAGKGGAEAGEAAPIPTDYELGNYPNPFNPVTTIRYGLPEAEHVRLEVFDMAGRRIALLVDGTKEAGTHEVRFDSGGLSSGLYLYRMQTLARVITGHMVLLK